VSRFPSNTPFPPPSERETPPHALPPPFADTCRCPCVCASLARGFAGAEEEDFAETMSRGARVPLFSFSFSFSPENLCSCSPNETLGEGGFAKSPYPSPLSLAVSVSDRESPYPCPLCTPSLLVLLRVACPSSPVGVGSSWSSRRVFPCVLSPLRDVFSSPPVCLASSCHKGSLTGPPNV